MIITRTPLRVSLVGGGTDMPAFYTLYGGAVISMAVDKYIYITVNPKFDGKIRVSYSVTENVTDPAMLKHDLVRAALELFTENGIEITSISDIPGEGSGLGSSSSFTVGLLLALSEKCGGKWSPKTLAESAYLVENKFADHVTGKQDQYAAAFGGLKYYEFCKDGTVRVQPFDLLDEEKDFILSRMLLFWTGRTRKASHILKEQSHNLKSHLEYMEIGQAILETANNLQAQLALGHFDAIGEALHNNWHLKRRLAKGITDNVIDKYYQDAIHAGAKGGKICGAGGGGFFLFYAEPETHAAIEAAIGLRRVPIRLEERGSTVIYHEKERI